MYALPGARARKQRPCSLHSTPVLFLIRVAVWCCVLQLTEVHSLISSLARPSTPEPASLTVFVNSLNDTRFESATALLRRCGLTRVVRVWPVPPNEPSLVSASSNLVGGGLPSRFTLRSMSQQLSVRHAWLSAALDPSHGIPDDGYFLYFEDDIALDASVNPADVRDIIHAAASASRETGMFYLGLGCSLHHASEHNVGKLSNATAAFSWWRDGISFSRTLGLWTHAVGIFKWRAQWLWDEVTDSLTSGGTDSLVTDIIDPAVTSVSLLGGLSHLLPPHQWPVLAGSNLMSHHRPLEQGCGGDVDAGVGLFYQSSSKFPSQKLGYVSLDDAGVRARQVEAMVQGRPFEQVCSPLQPLGVLLAGALKRVFMIRAPNAPMTPVPFATSLQDSVVAVHVDTLPVSHRAVLRKASAVFHHTGCNAGIAGFQRQVAHGMTHRHVWMTIAADPSLRDDDFAVIFGGRAWPASPATDSWPEAAAFAAEQSQRAGIFWLSSCSQSDAACRTDVSCTSGSELPCTRCVSDCLLVYGMFKWRAAWLWDVVSGSLRRNATFHADCLSPAFLPAYLRHGLPNELEPDQWPASIPLFTDRSP